MYTVSKDVKIPFITASDAKSKLKRQRKNKITINYLIPLIQNNENYEITTWKSTINVHENNFVAQIKQSRIQYQSWGQAWIPTENNDQE